jgi:hypothetical protein
MTETALVKAQLIEMKEDLKTELPPAEGGKKINVQFNPDSMKVSFANALAQPAGGDQSAGTAGRQFVGAGTTKLALTLWFDVTQMTDKPVDDVRRLTADVIHFITPRPSASDKKKFTPPAARFVWGSFLFDGIVESLEESLEFFSPQGKPLRASVTLSISQQKILIASFTGDGAAPARPGQRPFTAAKQGDTIQGMFEDAGGGAKGGSGGGLGSGAGSGGGSGASGGSGFGAGVSFGASASFGGNDWQSVAAGNGIEDPLRLPPGALIDVNLKADVAGGFGGGGALSSPPASGASLPATITIQPPRARLGLN